MVDGLSEEERKKAWIYVLFADMDPSVHPLWGEEWLGRVVDDYGGYDVGGERREWLEELMKQKEWQIKGVFDYVYALSRCYDTHAPYIAIMEDDIIFAHDWFQRTISALSKIESLSQNPEDKFYNWIYLRLFYTETFQSWSEEQNRREKESGRLVRQLDNFCYRSGGSTGLYNSGVYGWETQLTVVGIQRDRSGEDE
ncbi:hypothetical protein ACHAPF_003808 [Botrytis cinerea]